MYLVKVSSKVVNDTLIFDQHFNSILPDNWQNQLDSAFENAYVYGRDVISKVVCIASISTTYAHIFFENFIIPVN